MGEILRPVMATVGFGFVCLQPYNLILISGHETCSCKSKPHCKAKLLKFSGGCDGIKISWSYCPTHFVVEAWIFVSYIIAIVYQDSSVPMSKINVTPNGYNSWLWPFLLFDLHWFVKLETSFWKSYIRHCVLGVKLHASLHYPIYHTLSTPGKLF